MSFAGEGLPPNRGTVYALWFISSDQAARLGFTPRVGTAGRLQFEGRVPAGVALADFDAIVLTRESDADPARPGAVVLSGALSG
jgi:hypothetical protein